VSSENTAGYVLFALITATVLGAGLKLANIITLGWPLVTAPLWAPIISVLVLFVIGKILVAVNGTVVEHTGPLGVVR
jgi:hypothetical protein